MTSSNTVHFVTSSDNHFILLATLCVVSGPASRVKAKLSPAELSIESTADFFLYLGHARAHDKLIQEQAELSIIGKVKSLTTTPARARLA